MENAIATIRTDIQFKSPELQKATTAIASTMATLAKAGDSYKQAHAKAQKEVAKTLYEVGQGKYYKVDGFKSLAEYGETIGLEKSTVHKLENAGRMLCNENKKVAELAKNMDYSKLAILSSADPVKLNDAINKGEINPGMTSQEVKEWKERNTECKPKIEKRMNYIGQCVIMGSQPALDDPTITDYFPDTCPIEYYNALKEELPFVSDYLWSFVKNGDTRIHVGFAPACMQDNYTGPMFAWYVETPVVKTNTTNAKPTMTADDIKKALAAMPLELRKAILASME